MALWDDDRGQSVQVGVVLLFAVLVILLAMYQSTVVPDQDKAAEFEHSLAVQQDMLEARNAILETYHTGESAPVTVGLGMTYPNHVLAVDPAPVGGTLRTASGGSVSVSDAGGTVDACPVSSETKVLNYSAGYNFLRPRPTMVYENTVLYADYGEGNRVMVSGQSLVVGDTINLIALRGNYSKNGIAATDFAPKAGQYRTTPVSDPTIEVPTRLTKSQWESLLAGEISDPDQISFVDSPDGRRLQLNLNGSYDVRCGLVGAESVPEGGPRQNAGGVDINPAGPGDVVVENPSYNKGQKELTADFNNTADTETTITKARLAFYYAASGKSAPDYVQLSGHPETFPAGGSMQTLDTPIDLPANQATSLTFTGDGEPIQAGDFFIVQIEFADGNRGTYFIFAPG